MPEVVYGEGKTDEQVCEIVDALRARSTPVLVTRLRPVERLRRLASRWPDAVVSDRAGALRVGAPREREDERTLLVICAGTSDLPVAEEAMFTAETFGLRTALACDVGVAGIHRLFAHRAAMADAAAIIVVAGMEGALAGVVAGLVSVPVIAVPTSVGYGANLGGLSALLGMMTACAPGISVVNIDNGFGAAAVAWRVLRTSRTNA